MLINKLPLAEDDLIDLWIYGCQKWGINQADRYLDSIENKLGSLCEFPEKHSLRKMFKPPVRICPHISHIIIYTIEKDSILVVRVLHKSMEVINHL